MKEIEMPRCANCNVLILFLGRKQDKLRYCGKSCLKAGPVSHLAKQLGVLEVERVAWEIKKGDCPLCEKREHVEIHKSYELFSLVLVIRNETYQYLCCRKCGFKKQLVDFIGTFLFGWWGYPAVFFTPVKLVAGLLAMLLPPSEKKASKALTLHVRTMLAEQYIASGYRNHD